MALACDLKMFPGASDVVRVGTERWTLKHGAILEELLDEVRRYLADRSQAEVLASHTEPCTR